MVNGKAVELLKFLEMALEEEEAKAEEQQAVFYMNHISRVNARAPQDRREAKAQREFVKSIQPKPKIKQGPTKVYEWDVEQLKRLAAK